MFEYFKKLFSKHHIGLDECIVPEVMPYSSQADQSEAAEGDRIAGQQSENDPGESREQYINFTTTNRHGSVKSHGEEWYPDGNVNKVKKEITKVETCSGSVTHPHSVRAVCCVSGRHTDEYVRCSRGGGVLCLFHAAVLRTMDGNLILCPKHLKRERVDTWAGASGNLISLPEKPFSVSALIRTNERNNEQEAK